MSDVPQTPATPTEPASPTPTTTPTPADPSPAAPVADAPKEPSSLLSSSEPPKEPEFDAEKLTLPEGFDKSEANTMYAGFTGLAKELGLSQSAAQKLVDFHIGETQKSSAALQQSWTTTQEGWIAEVKADKEVGNLNETRAVISKVMSNREFTDPGFEEAMALTGAGNHPAVIRSLYRWAKALSEGGPVTGAPPQRPGTSSRPSPADALYGPDGPVTGRPNLARN